MKAPRRSPFFGNLPAITLALFGVLAASAQTVAQAPAMVTVPPIARLDDFVSLSPAQLDALYAAGSAVALPVGKVKGRALQFPGTAMARPAARVSRLAWQGKVIDPSGTSAVNRFFGVQAVRADVYLAESWRDGRPALILDYGKTSHVYANYRDEIRQVAPGLYLGLMYARTTPASLKLYFALDARP